MTFDDTASVIRDLWPQWDPTPAERDLWRRRCSRLNQDWLKQAVEEHRIRSKFLTPNLGEVLKCFGAIRESYRTGVTVTTSEPRRSNCVIDHDRFIDQTGQECSKAQEEASILKDLERLPRDEVLACRDRFIEEKGRWAKPKQESDDPREWGPFFRGLLWAYMESQA